METKIKELLSLCQFTAKIIAARKSLDCYRHGSDQCAVCRAGLELPILLARAADVAAADGHDDMAQALIAKAYYVADLLLPEAPPGLAAALAGSGSGADWICEGAARAAAASPIDADCSVAIGRPSG
jgi:hypothetical protein